MTQLLKSQLAGVIRFLMIVAGVLAIKHHWLSKSEANIINAAVDPFSVAGSLMTGGALIWGILHKNQVNTALVVAAATGTTTATPTAASETAVFKKLTDDKNAFIATAAVALAKPMPAGLAYSVKVQPSIEACEAALKAAATIPTAKPILPPDNPTA